MGHDANIKTFRRLQRGTLTPTDMARIAYPITKPLTARNKREVSRAPAGGMPGPAAKRSPASSPVFTPSTIPITGASESPEVIEITESSTPAPRQLTLVKLSDNITACQDDEGNNVATIERGSEKRWILRVGSDTIGKPYTSRKAALAAVEVA